MAKMDKMAKGLENLNIDGLEEMDAILDKSKEEQVVVEDKKYIINYLQIGTKVITVQKEEGSDKWETMTENVERSLVKELKILNAQRYAINNLSGAKKFQSGIYFDTNLNEFIKLYLFNLNLYLTSNESKNYRLSKKISKADLTDNILNDYFAKNRLIKVTEKGLEKRKGALTKLSNELLDKTYQDLPLRYLLNIKRSKQGLYVNLNLFEKLLLVSDYFYTEQEGGKALLVNNILKSWFIENNIVSPKIFVEDLATFDKIKFKESQFLAYFEIKNKISDDNAKLVTLTQ